MRQALMSLFSILLTGIPAMADEPCKSGLQPSQRPGPYSSLVAVGPQRGQQHCYICEAADKPVVIVFARSLSEPLGKLVGQIDRAIADNKSADVRGWVTFLSEDQTALDPKVVQWAQKHAIKRVPLGIFEDTVGPPAYLLHKDAEVTVLLSVRQKVVANFAFRAGELNGRLGAAGGFLEADFEIVAEMCALPRAGSPASPGAEQIPEAEDIAQPAKNVLEAGERAGIKAAESAGAGACNTRMPIAVVGRALLRVGEHGIGLAAFLEALFRVRIVGIAVRMVLHRQLAIGSLDLLLGGAARHAQHFVVVAFGIRCQMICLGKLND